MIPVTVAIIPWSAVKKFARELLRKGSHLLPFSGRSRMATHEAGHAIVAWHSSCVVNITKITIVPDRTSEYGAATSYEVFNRLKPEDLWERIAISLAGLAAEALVRGDLSIGGSSSDLDRAGIIAENIADLPYDLSRCPWTDVEYAPQRFDLIPLAYKSLTSTNTKILNICLQRAVMILEAHREQLNALTTAIKTQDTLDSEAVSAVLGERPTFTL